jgi:hypothetical protein
MLYFLTVFSQQKPTADLTPPFYANAKNRIGYWETTGSTLVSEESVVLVPPIQFRQGGIWNTLPAPYGVWWIDISMKITEGTGGGGFGLWFIEGIGNIGDFYGCAGEFKGISVIGAVFVNDSGTRVVKIRMIESNGTEEFSMFSEESKFDQIHVLRKSPITMRLKLGGGEAAFSMGGITTTKTIIYDISKCWFGITGNCDDYTSRIEVHSVRYGTTEYEGKNEFERLTVEWIEKRGYGQLFSGSRVSGGAQVVSRLFRNPSFVLLKAALLQYRNQTIFSDSGKWIDCEMKESVEEGVGSDTECKVSFESVLSAIVELNEAMIETATYTSLSTFVSKSLTRVTQEWYRRTFKIIEMSHNTSLRLSGTLYETIKLIEGMNSSMQRNWGHAEMKVTNLSEFLFSAVSPGIQLDPNLVNDSNDDFWYLRYFVYVELFFVIFLYIRESLRSLRH